MRQSAAKTVSQAIAIQLEGLENRLLFAKAPLFTVENLVSNNTTNVPATNADPNLINGWGLSIAPGPEQGVTNNGASKGTLYDGSGNVDSLVIPIPPAGGAGTQSLPTA